MDVLYTTTAHISSSTDDEKERRQRERRRKRRCRRCRCRQRRRRRRRRRLGIRKSKMLCCCFSCRMNERKQSCRVTRSARQRSCLLHSGLLQFRSVFPSALMSRSVGLVLPLVSLCLPLCLWLSVSGSLSVCRVVRVVCRSCSFPQCSTVCLYHYRFVGCFL